MSLSRACSFRYDRVAANAVGSSGRRDCASASPHLFTTSSYEIACMWPSGFFVLTLALHSVQPSSKLVFHLLMR